MKHPGFQQKLLCLLAAASFVVAGPGIAQPPENGAKKRAKPQVIYHLPPSSSYAATLHSQAKGQNNDRPVDSGTPTTPQVSRENSNASGQPKQEAPVAAPAEAPKQQARQQQEKRAKAQSIRTSRPQPSKAKGPGPGGSKKSHKK